MMAGYHQYHAVQVATDETLRLPNYSDQQSVSAMT